MLLRDVATGKLEIGSLAIGNVTIDRPWVQAALSGYSDLAMRRVARRYGAPYALNEVVIDEKVLQRGKGRERILFVPDDDHPVGGQLMGSAPENFALAAKDLVDAGYDVIDINFGCPVGKVLGRCRGGYLLGQPRIAIDIVERVVESVAGRRPVTVKLRRGVDDSPESEAKFFEILDAIFAAGVAAVTVHGRTVAQKYEGPSSTDFLRRVKAHAGARTVLASGDLFTAEDVLRVLAATGCDGATIARGAIGNPFVFENCDRVASGAEAKVPSLGEQATAIRLHLAEALRLCKDASRAVGATRRHAVQYARLHPDAIACRDAWCTVRCQAEFERVCRDFYDAA